MNCPHVPYKVYQLEDGSKVVERPLRPSGGGKAPKGGWWIVVPYPCPICGVEVIGGKPHPQVTNQENVQRILVHVERVVKEQAEHGCRETSILDLVMAQIIKRSDAIKILGIGGPVAETKLTEVLMGRAKRAKLMGRA